MCNIIAIVITTHWIRKYLLNRAVALLVCKTYTKRITETRSKTLLAVYCKSNITAPMPMSIRNNLKNMCRSINEKKHINMLPFSTGRYIMRNIGRKRNNDRTIKLKAEKLNFDSIKPFINSISGLNKISTEIQLIIIFLKRSLFIY
jgi:hypothetical protein